MYLGDMYSCENMFMVYYSEPIFHVTLQQKLKLLPRIILMKQNLFTKIQHFKRADI